MLGYVKPAVGNLRVCEHELYRAAYCGLCRSMGKCTGCASTLALSYDFVFLALIRHALTGERIAVESGRCVAHPLKKKPYTVSSEALRYSAVAAALLAAEKNRDDIADESGFRRLFAGLARPVLSHSAKKAEKGKACTVTAEDIGELSGVIRRELQELSRLEAERRADIDSAANCFGRLLSAVMCAGLEGVPKRIAEQVGMYTGRFIYIIDAADDAAEDVRRGRYNPIISAYGESAVEEREITLWNGRKRTRGVLKRDVGESVLCAARMDLGKIEAAENLIDYSDDRIMGIIHNIIGMGMPGALMEVLGLSYTKDQITEGFINE